METVARPPCGCSPASPKTERTIFAYPNGMRIVECVGCRLWYSNPRLNTIERARWYDREMYANDSAALSKRSLFDQNAELLQRKAVRQIERFYPRKGRLLDVGCGTGVFLLAAQQSGWEAMGLEGNPQAAAESQTRVRNVKQGDIAEECLASASFDVVTLWQVLEHLPEPLPILRKLFEALKPGGRLFVAVPNAASLSAKLLGRRWFNFQNPTHLIHFTFGTLAPLLSKAGFADVRRLYFFGGRPGFGPLRNALQYPLRVLGLGSEIRVCARKCEN